MKRTLNMTYVVLLAVMVLRSSLPADAGRLRDAAREGKQSQAQMKAEMGVSTPPTLADTSLRQVLSQPSTPSLPVLPPVYATVDTPLRDAIQAAREQQYWLTQQFQPLPMGPDNSIISPDPMLPYTPMPPHYVYVQPYQPPQYYLRFAPVIQPILPAPPPVFDQSSAAPVIASIRPPAEGGGQKAEGGGQKAEGEGQKAEGGGRKAEGEGQKAEGEGQRAGAMSATARAHAARREAAHAEAARQQAQRELRALTTQQQATRQTVQHLETQVVQLQTRLYRLTITLLLAVPLLLLMGTSASKAAHELWTILRLRQQRTPRRL